MKSLAIKNDYAMAQPSTGEAKDYFPSLTINESQVPELAKMEIGDECVICVKVKVTGMNADNNGTRINLDCLAAEYDADYNKDSGEE